MAQKKKTTSRSRKKPEPEIKERSAFWPLSFAVILCVIALFMLLGGFGTGGPLPVGLFHGGYWLVGWAAYLIPFMFVLWAVTKFSTEDHRMPAGKLTGVSAIMVFVACFLFTSFADKTTSGAWQNGHGGRLGAALGGAALSLLDKLPASILFLVLATLATFFAFAISPKVLLKIADIFTREEADEDTDMSQLKHRAETPGFKLNEGVPVEHTDVADKPRPRLASLKNSAVPEKMPAPETHEALTLASDPDWKFPGVDLLDAKQDKADPGDVNGNAKIIHDTFANFNIDVEMEGANVGPRVTQYTLKPPTGVRLTKITALENNLALDLAAHAIRMEAPIPGKRAVGIEVPNVKPAIVGLSSILQSRDWNDSKEPLTFAIGKDIGGRPVVVDLAKMPHLLVAGQTGSGKSVMINDILTSLLYRNSPSDLKLILVDPKQVELTPYNNIPHLLTPVINEPEKCISALKWAVAEMERRLRTMAEVGKRNIGEYNNLKKEEGMPYIVIVIDELADLMMMAARDVESLVVRLAQKARAAGIHLVLATQRPSVDVITGLIKANVPARVAFTVASQVDSRTIIDQMGAEKLLGRGDMLLSTSDMPKPKRVQAAFISDEETEKVTAFIRDQRPPQYDDEIISQPVQIGGKGSNVVEYGGGNDADDDMWKDAVKVVIEGGKASTSLLQRRLRIGYGRAARLIETMEEQGIVGPADGSRPREVLVSSLDEVFAETPIQEESGPDDTPQPPAPQSPRETFLVQ
ncbi:MAG TPA: DNA translocase FtsK 4TM domain-containing protein [Candidatus Saccharimonadales bacterium]|nr:DNA translocase FtsK 4TM domain-containing protein [Candidatus Saccharimonadales bacterium]